MYLATGVGLLDYSVLLLTNFIVNTLQYAGCSTAGFCTFAASATHAKLQLYNICGSPG